MLNVLIVDDEPYIRQGLRLIIDWEAEGFCIVGEASNGVEALEMLTCSEVDLVIADIQMPEMGGLQLLSEIRERGMNDLQFVILSGYPDFAYAQTAMKYGCQEYIIKPINRDELLTLLRKIKQSVQQKLAEEENEKLRDSALLERNLLPLLVGKYDDINLSYVKEHLDLSGRVRYISFELDMSDSRLYNKNEESRRSMQRMLYSGLRSAFGGRSSHVIFDVSKDENCYDVGVIYCDAMAAEQSMSEQNFCIWLLEKVEPVVDCRVEMQVGCRVDSLEQISESYRSASVARFMQDFQENLGLKTSDEHLLMQNELPTEMYMQVKKHSDAVISAVEMCSKQEIETAVDALYRSMGELCMDYRLISMYISSLLSRLLHIAFERDSNLDQSEAFNYIIENAFNKGVVRGSAAHFAKFCCEYAEYLKQMESQSAGNILSLVEHEIAEKYMTNISLKQLGEQFYINSAYLGQLFKKHYSVSFKDYLNMVRINKSVELLARTDMKVYEISAAVGYQSVDYFINKFVALRGHTPAKYRKNVRGKIDDADEE